MTSNFQLLLAELRIKHARSGMSLEDVALASELHADEIAALLGMPDVDVEAFCRVAAVLGLNVELELADRRSAPRDQPPEGAGMALHLAA